MKTTKRVLACLLTVVMLAAMLVVPATAANYTISINSDHVDHSYEAYQIFTGSLSGSVLSDIVWGSGVSDDGKTTLLTTYGKTTAAEIADTLSESNVAAFAETAAQCLEPSAKYTGEWNGNDKFVITGLPAGYYLVKETSSLNGSSHAYTAYILCIVSNVELMPKSGTPTITKEVKLGTTGTYKEAISATVGDTVYFKVTASLHTRIFDYEDYYFRFEDTLPAGLTYTGAKAYVVDDTQVAVELFAADYTIDVSGGVVSVTIPDIHTAVKNASGADTVISDKIAVEIATTVNTSTVIGGDGNINTAKLYFSNDPNEAYNGTGTPTSLGVTADAQARVYSYQINLLKQDSADSTKKLEGAEFIVGVKRSDNSYLWYTADANGVVNGTTTSEDNAARFRTDNTGTLTVKGLSSGTYHLREKVAPAQYNLLSSDVIVQFSGTLDQNTGVLNALTVTDASNVVNYSANYTTGTVSLTVSNTKGATLPSTGGMGTTVFYAVGGCLVLGAVVVLLMKKRSVTE